MAKATEANLLRNIDRRLTKVEQILPGLSTKEQLREAVAPLATKEELREAIAPLATKEELRQAIAPLATREEMHAAIAAAVQPLATKEELRDESERTRRHMQVLVEGLRDEMRVIAEGHVSLNRQIESEIRRALVSLDERVTRLEAERPPRRR